jgi:predicted DNA-binding transcriptional regulator AlpA
MSDRPGTARPTEVPSRHLTEDKILPPSRSRPVPRRGLSRVEASTYLGVSPSKFDELVKDGRMPRPRLIDSRKVWDVYELDMAFDELPRQDSLSITGTSWDDR